MTISDEVNTRSAKASYPFGRIFNNDGHRNSISLQMKLKMNRAAILPVMLTHVEN